MNSLLLALLLSAAPLGAGAPMDFDSVVSRMAASPLHRIEGVWRFPADGGLVAVERTDRHSAAVEYVLAVVAAGNRMLRPGTVIGRISPTSKPDVFEARIYTSVDNDGNPTSAKTYTLTLTHDDSRLEIRHVRKGVKLNWWRLFPYMFRGIITPVDESPRNLDGCVRVYPEPAIPENPRYL